MTSLDTTWRHEFEEDDVTRLYMTSGVCSLLAEADWTIILYQTYVPGVGGIRAAPLGRVACGPAALRSGRRALRLCDRGRRPTAARRGAMVTATYRNAFFYHVKLVIKFADVELDLIFWIIFMLKNAW